MEIQVTIERILPDETWQSKKDGSTQTRHGFVGKTLEQYPKQMKFDVLDSEKWGKMRLQVGQICNVKFDAASREFNGKWYTSLNVWSAFLQGGQNNNAQVPQQVQQPTPQPVPTSSNNDVPF